MYTGDRGNLTRVICNFLPRSATFEATGGETYFILVGSPNFGEPGGNLVLTVDLGLEVGLTIDRVGRVDPVTNVVTFTGTATCSRPAHVELGGPIKQGRVSYIHDAVFVCDGVTGWESQSFLDVPLGAGPVRVKARALFTANATTEERHSEQVSATVHLESVVSGQ